jgi:hypothetical protein
MKTAHAIKHLTDHATQHVALAKSHKALSSHFAALAECMKAAKSEMKETDPATLYANVSGEFHKASQAHTALAESCIEASKALKESHKAAGMDGDLDDLMPSPISRVAPDLPGTLRRVYRPGQQEIHSADVSREFKKLVSVEDREEE